MSDPRILTVLPQPGEYAWTFGGAAPLARIAPGTVLDLYAEDCFAGCVRSEKDLVSEVCTFPYLNPQTGPFSIEGAEPGDTLAVHFVSVEPARDWAASTTVPLFGALTGTHTTAGLQPPLPERVWVWQLDRERRTARFAGETCGVAVECAMHTVVIVDLLKDLATPWPRIESDTHLVSTGSARPLEDAFRISQLDLVRWLVRDYGFSEFDAYQFLTQAVESPLANVCDTNYTSVAKVRKEWLPARDTHRAAHARRQTATTLTSR